PPAIPRHGHSAHSFDGPTTLTFCNIFACFGLSQLVATGRALIAFCHSGKSSPGTPCRCGGDIRAGASTAQRLSPRWRLPRLPPAASTPLPLRLPAPSLGSVMHFFL